MFYRPTNLAMAPEEAPAMLRFRRSGSKLTRLLIQRPISLP